ncbi:hypothetical protein K9N68_12080 [Kovacikia minuta CCNUW1]|uniref:hypothetical protein n=1 Tax=Kovacikia minuta TaxID=2931930 RepID=UPI001CCB482B|nr:hypothetical protein [Kovacikia minuta]UBF28543.1 hypothetical protein K9N68_12080 [Kovacikia minuta CCNUW1]
MHQHLLQIVTREFGLEMIEQRSPLVLPEPVSCHPLLERLAGSTDFIYPDTNEKTRAEMIVAPILIHLAVTYHLSFYSGTDFNAYLERGLTGTVDHLFSRATPVQSTIRPPITAVVETKSEFQGISHCLVQMLAAQQFNLHPSIVYGAVTTGLVWRFLKLEGARITVDLTGYPLFPINPLLSLLVPMIR